MLLLNTTLTSSADTVYGPPPSEDKPVLQVLKWVDDRSVHLGENITIHVNITNWSSVSAYNLSITEPIFNNWSRTDFLGYDNYVWVEIKSGGSISYDYSMTMNVEGNYSLKATIINYVDENTTSYLAQSSDIPINIYVTEILYDFSPIWQNIFWMASIIILVPIILLAINKFLWK